MKGQCVGASLSTGSPPYNSSFSIIMLLLEMLAALEIMRSSAEEHDCWDFTP